MKKRRMKKNLWNTMVVLCLFLGSFGSMSAWEMGNIGLGRMILQVVVFSAMGYCAAMMSANVRTTRRAAPAHALCRTHTLSAASTADAA